MYGRYHHPTPALTLHVRQAGQRQTSKYKITCMFDSQAWSSQ